MTDNELSGDDVAAVKDLIANSELRSVEYYELSAQRADAAPKVSEGPEDAELSITVEQRRDDDSFGVRLVANVAISVGSATASVAGEYALLNGHQPSVRTLQLFTNEVGVMTVFPYLREAIASCTSRVFGQPLQLPTVERGQIAVNVDPR
ncbi:hypothetical protein KK101_00555 [Curtobacterium flaccumfaciens pv. oortii]|jgi:preprotein translocase subunit SecB|uniref:hypothetical protein n=1 Tax=Curtobacterium TaxID=2034 RepID=UPI001BDE733C|nr:MULTISPECIES: hypothetical protein [Curtobacterium]MBT1621180.1 hypothetical protein [Curtobacterium flaccumfaciens pv. oortii]